MGFWSLKNLKFINMGVAAIALVSCTDKSNTDLDINVEQAFHEKYSVERKYSGSTLRAIIV